MFFFSLFSFLLAVGASQSRCLPTRARHGNVDSSFILFFSGPETRQVTKKKNEQ